MKREYKEGDQARKAFEGAMKILFQAPKESSKKKKQARKPATLRKLKSSDKD